MIINRKHIEHIENVQIVKTEEDSRDVWFIASVIIKTPSEQLKIKKRYPISKTRFKLESSQLIEVGARFNNYYKKQLVGEWS